MTQLDTEATLLLAYAYKQIGDSIALGNIAYDLQEAAIMTASGGLPRYIIDKQEIERGRADPGITALYRAVFCDVTDKALSDKLADINRQDETKYEQFLKKEALETKERGRAREAKGMWRRLFAPYFTGGKV